jgi:hypothetical protein
MALMATLAVIAVLAVPEEPWAPLPTSGPGAPVAVAGGDTIPRLGSRDACSPLPDAFEPVPYVCKSAVEGTTPPALVLATWYVGPKARPADVSRGVESAGDAMTLD